MRYPSYNYVFIKFARCIHTNDAYELRERQYSQIGVLDHENLHKTQKKENNCQK